MASELIHYPNWSLQDVIKGHRERLVAFIVHDGPRFASRDTATLFWDFMLSLAPAQTPAGQTVQVLRQRYLQFPEAAVSDKVQTALNTGNAKDILNILDPLIFKFPSGGATPTSFMDIGCGQGFKTSAMASAWCLPRASAIGLDIVRPQVIPHNFDFQLMLSHNLLPATIKPDSQDLAILSMVLHHSEDPPALLRAIHSALRPNGYLVIREHNLLTGKEEISDFLDTVHILYDMVFGGKACMPNVQNYKSLQDWLNLFEQCGFEHVKTVYSPFVMGKTFNTIEKFTCILRATKETL
ncbi:hypothetical protein HJFPF1_13088 [Paramyrothecium foliicola]|nr:hypothetical protein HJFPF1_13088 [Paramyrothecium foliicola]